MDKKQRWLVTVLVVAFLLWVAILGCIGAFFFVPQLRAVLPGHAPAAMATATAQPPSRPRKAATTPIKPKTTPVATPTVSPPLGGGKEAEALSEAFARVYREAAPSVVHIVVTEKITVSGGPQLFIFPTPEIPGFPTPEIPTPPQGKPYLEQSEGSGFVWDTQGHIVTNYHVVANAEEVEVIFFNKQAVKAKVVGTDPHSDLAVLKVNPRKVSLRPLPLGDSDKLVVGQLAVAIGNPFGETWTMTHGIVSALGRTEKSGSTPFSIPKMIQTDAPINPGNSGGPLLDIGGRVIGVNTMIMSPVRGSSGVGFAIPVNLVRRVVPVLIARGKYEYAWLGISGTDLGLDTAKAMDLPEDTHGALVIEVVPDSPAAKAGLRGSHRAEIYGKPMYVGGDVIVAVDGHKIESMSDLVTYLALKTRPGQTIKLTVIRHGKHISVPVTLAPRPEKLPTETTEGPQK